MISSKAPLNNNQHHASATPLIRKANHVAWLPHETNVHREELPKGLKINKSVYFQSSLLQTLVTTKTFPGTPQHPKQSPP